LKDINHSSLRAISPLIDEYAEWYGDVLRCLFYAEVDGAPLDNRVNNMFAEWKSGIERLEFIEYEAIDRLTELQRELQATAIALCQQSSDKGIKPDIAEFDKFSNLFYSLIVNLRRLEKDSVLEDSGIDVLTGLRSKNKLREDIDRELERLARRGKPFCLALAKIDLYEDIASEHGRSHAREYTKVVAGFIKKSVRSFDDAYRLGGGEFLLSLKQADMTGGIAALERLRRMLEASGTKFKSGGKERLLTMSCCIAEPLPDDNADELIDNLRADLLKVEMPSGAVLEYHEMSDLERYIQDGT
jgi:diguanylate cyclase (GGDEF)-like protein